ATRNPADDSVRTHVGYYLLGEGWKELAQALNRRVSGLRHFRRIARSRPSSVYFPALIVTFLPIYAGLCWFLSALQCFTRLQLGIAGLLLIPPVIGGSIRLLHTVLNWIFSPQILPKIE